MKAFISKIFHFVKSLFLRLHVIVTLQLGKNKVDEDGSNPEEDDPQNGERRLDEKERNC